MIRKVDDGKRRVWEKRLERFRASGLTAARFCRGEGVSPHMFHYWAKRIESAASGAAPCSVERSDSAKGSAPTVRFLFDRGVQVSIPADCLEAIRCLVDCVQQSIVAPSDSFHQVIVRDSSREAS